jgi:hypothetical protein
MKMDWPGDIWQTELRQKGASFANSLMARSYLQDWCAFTQAFTEKWSSLYKPTIVESDAHEGFKEQRRR